MAYHKVLERLILPIGQGAFGGDLLKPLQLYRGYQWMPSEKVKQVQKEKLKATLENACNKSSYYQQFNFNAELGPEENIQNFPILSKKTLNKHTETIATKQLDRLQKIATSGSSGEQSTVYFNKPELMIPRAIQVLWWEWAGYRLGNTVLQTGVNTKRSWEKQLKDIFLRIRYIDAFNHNRDSVKKELIRLRKKPKKFFCGFASSLYLFAKVAWEEGINDITFDGVISFGENLFPHYRDLIEKAFHTQVYDTYGCAEGLMVASQCAFGQYHVMMPHLYLELLDEENNPVKPGQMGRVIVTSLDNYSFPLIRYEVGDLAIMSEEKGCYCGRGLPILQQVVGRSSDVIQTPKGQYITVQTVTGIFKHFEEIRQFKFIKDPTGKFKILYKPSKEFGAETLEKLQHKFNQSLNEELNLHFEEVDTIDPAPSGKMQIMENQFSP